MRLKITDTFNKSQKSYQKRKHQNNKKIQILQDEIFKKMTTEKKLFLLDQFFRFGQKLQSLNDRRKENENN